MIWFLLGVACFGGVLQYLCKLIWDEIREEKKAEEQTKTRRRVDPPRLQRTDWDDSDDQTERHRYSRRDGSEDLEFDSPEGMSFRYRSRK